MPTQVGLAGVCCCCLDELRPRPCRMPAAGVDGDGAAMLANLLCNCLLGILHHRSLRLQLAAAFMHAGGVI